jgi:hypothetical protein
MGFEQLSQTYIRSATLWDITVPVFGVTNTAPRSGGSGQALVGNLGERIGTRTIPGGNYAHLFCGIGWMYRSTTLAATPANLDFTLFDGTTAQIGWVISNLGEVIVYRGGTTGGTELGRTATGVIVAAGTSGTGADYKMIEMEVVFATGATGSVVIKVADTTVLTVSSVQTAASANAYANRVRLIMRSDNALTRMDDFYINDNTGSAPENTFFGEAFVVEALVPNADGNSSQWLGSDGNSTNNYLLVDDTGNDDTDYVASGTLNDIDTYNLPSLTNATGTVIGVNLIHVARKDDVATRTIAGVLRTASTNYVGSNKTMSGTYTLYEERTLINANTSLRFTISDVNGLEIGQKLTT